jgi:hypothetical protein
LKGAFYFEGESLISHQYTMKVSQQGKYQISIHVSSFLSPQKRGRFKEHRKRFPVLVFEVLSFNADLSVTEMRIDTNIK